MFKRKTSVIDDLSFVLYLLKIIFSHLIVCSLNRFLKSPEAGHNNTVVILALQNVICVIKTDTKRPWTSISWRAPNKDTYTFHNADQFDGIVAHPDGSLEIKDFKKIDNGTYECIAKNYQGQIKAKTEIKYSESTSENEEKMIVRLLLCFLIKLTLVPHLLTYYF